MDWSRRQAMTALPSFAATMACSHSREQSATDAWVDVRSDALADVLDPSGAVQELARGFTWSEGPAWDRTRGCLYFSDVPENKAYRWSAEEGLATFLAPSGIDASHAHGFRELGSNGLWCADDGSLFICNHGRRAVERLDIESGGRSIVVSHYQGRAFNSPNDLVFARDGTLYFTDPPYGLEGLSHSPLKAMEENGVYRRRPSGAVERILDDMTFPNGVALSPSEDALYISQSDPDDHYIRRLILGENGSVVADERWFEASALSAAGEPGLCDGLAVAADGTVFAAGPGGVLILDPEGRLLGRIVLGGPTGNCTFGEDGRSLFITSGQRLVKVRTKALGLRWATGAFS
ncbi:MAG: SMP-30/gluconolactonase/LRE family protein [Pseudomonadota bacterium]